jgi:preprotein translocase subunit SecA
LRGYAQKNPKQEYKREAFEMFSGMLDAIKHEVVSILSRLQVQAPPPVELGGEQEMSGFQFQHEEFEGFGDAPPESSAGPANDAAAVLEKKPFVRPGRKIGRNEPCPCGSGKKYKQCHGKLQ